MFLPTTKAELTKLGWQQLDVILVSGDSYIDSPYIGVAVIGKVLQRAGFRVGIIAQPDVTGGDDMTRLGEPALFWGVTGGSVDSMVANYTASNKRRKQDDYTPGGRNTLRPDRATLIYSNLIRQHFKNTAPIVLGGIEASLRRVAHYDAWSNSIRRSLLFDAKADYLLYGMAEHSVVQLAHALAEKSSPHNIKGLCYKAPAPPQGATVLPSYQECKQEKSVFAAMFSTFYANTDPATATCLAQQHDNRFLIQNPPQPNLTTAELDQLYTLQFERELHPYYARKGKVRALDTIRFAVTTHRGCYGECNFCAIAVHQGRTVQSRSEQSIIDEVSECTRHPAFKGIISDVGGPTANMWGVECRKKIKLGTCDSKRCIFPSACPTMPIDHGPQIRLLKKLRALPKIRKIFIASGIRYDMILADKQHGKAYLKELIKHHISGQMKIAPEHCSKAVLDAMGKPGIESLDGFRKLFTTLAREQKKRLFLTYYLIAAHPGSTMKSMQELKSYARKVLKVIPRQIQIFTPTPSTWSTLMYWTEKNPWSGKPCFVEKQREQKERQKKVLTQALPNQRPHRPAAKRKHTPKK
ncbi:MAG: YgiQ family radical SAM protein [Desulfobulbus propionicus]|nr:MAG: YgiQ family radical SAM protein [Desulfobulbus propionicus]